MLTPDTIIAGKYRIEHAIGQGGYGQVYLGHDLTMDRQVAIKELLRSEAASSPEEWQDYQLRFRKEAQLLSRFSNENVVTAHALETTDTGDMYLVLEYVGGGSLKQVLDEGKPLPVERALAIAIDICRAVDAIYKRDIVHRDIKPSNILLAEDGRAKLTDFGVAQVGTETHRTQEATGHPGTPAYKSPEQAATTGCLDQRSDLYALGLVLYEMLTGQHYARNHVPPRQLNEQVPPALSAVAMRALQEQPDARYQSAQEMLRDLEMVREQSTLGQLRIVLHSLPTPRLVMLGAFVVLLAFLLSMGRLAALLDGDQTATPAGEQALSATASVTLATTWTTVPGQVSPGALPAYELDDQVPAAISVGETQQRVFETEGDIDRVTFRAKAGQTYVIATDNLAAGVDTALEVQFDGQRLANDDAAAGTMASEVLLAPTQDTTVVVVVSNSDRYGLERTYDLSVTLEGEQQGVPQTPSVLQPTLPVGGTADAWLTLTPRATVTKRATWTVVPSVTARATYTKRVTATLKATSTRRATWTRVPTWTPTKTKTRTPTSTKTPTNTATNTATNTPTNTATHTPTHTATHTATNTATTEVPTATTEVPTATTEVPTATTEVPTATTEVPTATTEVPTATTEVPTATTEPTATEQATLAD